MDGYAITYSENGSVFHTWFGKPLTNVILSCSPVATVRYIFSVRYPKRKILKIFPCTFDYFERMYD